MNATELLEAATKPEPLDADDRLRGIPREEAMTLTPALRLRWFYLVQVRHAELKRVTEDLMELLEANIEVKVVSIIGMTGIGKTTLASTLLNSLLVRFGEGAVPSDVPVIYVRAPANGQKSLSWTGLYKRILEAGHDVMIGQKRAATVTDGELRVRRGGRTNLTELRDFIEEMLKQRNVRVLVIDEALHLLRFDEYSAIMDTLKSLADIHHTKLLLIGTYDISELMIEYGQVARRSEIIHYRRYVVGEIKADAPTPDQDEFRQQVVKFQSLWPCAEVPNLEAIWPELMKASLGSIGLLKAMLLRLLSLQMAGKGELITKPMLKKFSKAPRALRKIEEETVAGEATLIGACYGDSIFGAKDDLDTLMQRIRGRPNV
jgi:hypothetical protein